MHFYAKKTLINIVLKYLFLLSLLCGCVSPGTGEITVRVTIDFAGNAENISETTKVANGSSALDCFSSVANLSVVWYSFGEYVSGINGIMEGNGYYWIYYVNGGMATVGAGNYQVQDWDVLKFVYEIPEWGAG